MDEFEIKKGVPPQTQLVQLAKRLRMNPEEVSGAADDYEAGWYEANGLERPVKELDVETMLDPSFTPRPKDYIEGLFEAGEVVHLAGMWGAGKSTLALSAALAVADPGRSEFLGHAVRKHGKVLYFDQENPSSSLQGRVFGMMRGRAMPDPESMQLVQARPLSFSDSSERRQIHDAVRRVQPDLVVLDSYVGFLGDADENGAGAMRRLFNEGVRPITEMGTTVIILDHTTKSYAESTNPNIAARGSGDKAAASDRIWLLHVVDPRSRLLELRFGRSRNDIPAEAIRFQERREDGSLDYTLEERREGEEFDRLLDMLYENDGEMKLADLARSMGEPDTTARRIIREAEAAGAVKFVADPTHSQRKLVVLPAKELVG